MTDLIPLDAAIAAVYHADSFELSLCGTSRIEGRIELIPAIDPAAIREAALREARGKLHDIMCLPDFASVAVARQWASEVYALIGEKK